MIYAGKKTSSTPGTPVSLAPQRTPACWVKIQALDNNKGLIYITGSGNIDSRNSSSTTDKTGGIDIVAGGILPLGDSAAINYYDLNKIQFDVDNSGDGVKFLYGVR